MPHVRSTEHDVSPNRTPDVNVYPTARVIRRIAGESDLSTRGGEVDTSSPTFASQVRKRGVAEGCANFPVSFGILVSFGIPKSCAAARRPFETPF